MTRTEHLLTILAEECQEVAQRVSKALRFGLTEVQPGQSLTNAERVVYELNDLLAVWRMLRLERLLPCILEDNAMIEAKVRKVETFLQFSAARGLVDGQLVIPDYPHPETQQQPTSKE